MGHGVPKFADDLIAIGLDQNLLPSGCRPEGLPVLRRKCAARSAAFRCVVIPSSYSVIPNLKTFLIALALRLASTKRSHVGRIGEGRGFAAMNFIYWWPFP